MIMDQVLKTFNLLVGFKVGVRRAFLWQTKGKHDLWTKSGRINRGLTRESGNVRFQVRFFAPVVAGFLPNV